MTEQTLPLSKFKKQSLVNVDELDILISKEQHIPGAVDFNLRRYFSQGQWDAEDRGVIHYTFIADNHKENVLELEFLVTGNKICDDQVCVKCGQNPTLNCQGKFTTIDVFSFRFPTAYLNKFTLMHEVKDLKDEVLAFKHKQSFSKSFPLCIKKKNILNDLLVNSYSGAMHNIFVNARIYELLLLSMGCIVDEEKSEFECKFLADKTGIDKVYLARDILLERISQPITIKELSRKVATNECYLKKGFKEVFGMTIFEFYQQQRMEHAKYLLYEKGLTVTDVSNVLGYSSVTHFSAAFKKHTGMKPCELLQ